jgi:hypothetical protein
VTYKVVGAMKRAEGLGVFDEEAAFSPFRMKM